MRYQAVIFDLFGTLVPNNRDEPYHKSIGQMARLLGADPAAFLKVWTSEELTTRRFTGAFASQADCVRHVLAAIGAQAPDEAVVRASKLRAEYNRGLLTPRPDAVETLREIRRRGLKVGLMSACSTDTPATWRTTPLAPLFDEALFSSELGMTKPDPRFYALACERLAVPAGGCLYVGDGAGHELTGAAAAGMTAVLLCDPAERDIVLARAEARDWQGARVERLSEVPSLLGE